MTLDLDRDYERRFITRHQTKVVRSLLPDVCWPWSGATNRNGYGTLRGGGKHISETGIRWIYQAHRVALAIATCPPHLTIFQWMDGEQARLEAAHTCHVRLCQNDNHLRWKTHRQNIHDILEQVGRLGVPVHNRGRRLEA